LDGGLVNGGRSDQSDNILETIKWQ
jgi:hypothetical protein